MLATLQDSTWACPDLAVSTTYNWCCWHHSLFPPTVQQLVDSVTFTAERVSCQPPCHHSSCLVKGWATTLQLHIHLTLREAASMALPSPHALHPLPAFAPPLRLPSFHTSAFTALSLHYLHFCLLRANTCFTTLQRSLPPTVSLWRNKQKIETRAGMRLCGPRVPEIKYKRERNMVKCGKCEGRLETEWAGRDERLLWFGERGVNG